MEAEQLTGQNVLDYLKTLSPEQLSKPFLVYDTQQVWYTSIIQIGVIEEAHLSQKPVSVYGGGHLELGTPYIAAL